MQKSSGTKMDPVSKEVQNRMSHVKKWSCVKCMHINFHEHMFIMCIFIHDLNAVRAGLLRMSNVKCLPVSQRGCASSCWQRGCASSCAERGHA